MRIAASVPVLLIANAYAFRFPSINPLSKATSLSSSSSGSLLSTPEDTPVDQYRETNPLLKGFVSALTSGINAAVGAPIDDRITQSQANVRPISPAALKSKIQIDYAAAYFVTGDISPECYDADCTFTDPTISFSGLATWTRNIASLKTFLRDPRIDLISIQLNQAKNTIETKWRLTTEVALPWAPFIDCYGSTVHRYDPKGGNRIVEHVESWEVSGLEAVLQMFRPGRGREMGTAKRDATTTKQAIKNERKKNPSSIFSKARMMASAIMPIPLGFLSTGLTDQIVSRSSISSSFAAHAQDKREVASIPASGLIFKDTISVEAFPDPKVKGITLYVSDFRRPLAERLAKDFFSDPSQASITCLQSGPITIGKIDTSKEGEEVFTEARNLLFKTIRVRRIFDKEANALVYVSYSTRFSKNDDDNKSRFKSSLCAIPLSDDYGTAQVDGGL